MAKQPTVESAPDHGASSHLFLFDLDLAIRDQVVKKLISSHEFPLETGVAPSMSGIYALYHNGKLVYVGKASKETTKSERTLRIRLNEHVTKIQGRRNISLQEMTCKFLTFESEWYVFAAEYVLIAYFQPMWNTTGFGSKVPGAGRPGTSRVSVWDSQFPKK